MWPVEVTDEFADWFASLREPVQDDIDRIVGVLEARGPDLPFPLSSALASARVTHLRELRVQSGGKPYRIFYAFDPRRTAILLIGGCKAGRGRFYQTMLPVAEQLYEDYLDELHKEGLI